MSVKIEKKIKGYSVIQPGSTPQPSNASEVHYLDQPERRIKLTEVAALEDSMRWVKRPHDPAGVDGRTYMVHDIEPSTGDVNKRFGILINHVKNGSPQSGYPFEVWVLGDGAPRGLSALCKSLSMDMRQRDWAYFRTKLEAISKTIGDAFDMEMPDGTIVRMPSETAAAARLILYRCKELGVFSDEQLTHTPVLDGLMSKKEPKTTAVGAPSWSWDVRNAGPRDDFLLTLKQVELDDGRMVPISVWMAGNYPDSFDGLCKSLSYDMRINSVGWIARKLKQLLNVKEDGLGMMAPVPGSEKSRYYESTIAYVATLILNHYKALGLVDENFAPIGKSATVVLIGQARSNELPATDKKDKIGRLCTACDAYAVVRLDGCDTCASCGTSKCS